MAYCRISHKVRQEAETLQSVNDPDAGYYRGRRGSFANTSLGCERYHITGINPKFDMGSVCGTGIVLWITDIVIRIQI